MDICRIYETSCFVVNPEKNKDFERVLSILMVPIKAFDDVSNTYTIHVTRKLLQYIERECRFREVTVLSKNVRVVNLEEYRAYKLEKKKGEID